MSTDVSAVEKVLQVYFDGLYEGDTKKLGEAFHPASHLYAPGADGKATMVFTMTLPCFSSDKTYLQNDYGWGYIEEPWQAGSPPSDC